MVSALAENALGFLKANSLMYNIKNIYIFLIKDLCLRLALNKSTNAESNIKKSRAAQGKDTSKALFT